MNSYQCSTYRDSKEGIFLHKEERFASLVSIPKPFPQVYAPGRFQDVLLQPTNVSDQNLYYEDDKPTTLPTSTCSRSSDLATLDSTPASTALSILPVIVRCGVSQKWGPGEIIRYSSTVYLEDINSKTYVEERAWGSRPVAKYIGVWAVPFIKCGESGIASGLLHSKERSICTFHNI